MLRQSYVVLLGTILLAVTSFPAHAIVIAEFDFEAAPDGTSVASSVPAITGELTDNATVGDGVLTLENIDLSAFENAIDAPAHGLLVPLGQDSPFGGSANWSVKFDFSVEEGSDNSGALFTSDGGLCPDECNDGEQAGSLNIFMTSGGEIVADAWFIGAIGSGEPLNDGLTHQVQLTYNAAEDGLWELWIDRDISESEDSGGLEVVEEANWPYTRDASLDRTGVGFVTNPDFGFEIDAEMDGIAAVIDNLVIEGTPSPDLNQDGELSLLDWAIFVENFGTDLTGKSELELFLAGDLNGDGAHGASDFVAFRTAYLAANAGEAEAASVPEPAGLALLGIGSLALLSLRRRNARRAFSRCVPALLMAGVMMFATTDSAQAQLVEYLFEDGAADTSGNDRAGELVDGLDEDTTVSDGVLNLPGEFSGMEIPLGDANPFDGSRDFTIEFSFMADEQPGESGHVLFGSADADDPEAEVLHSMALFLEDSGDIVYDSFGVAEVRISPPEFVIGDGMMHDFRLSFVAPEELGEDLNEPNPGEVFMQLDGIWYEAGEMAPNVPNIDNHVVMLGSSLNEIFPFECEINEEGDEECYNRSFRGQMDNVRIFEEAFAPSTMTAEVNRASGDLTIKGGELGKEITYYEVTSESGSINEAAWATGNLDSQNVDSLGDGSGEGWEALFGSSERIVEAFLTGGTFLADGDQVTLSGAWNGGSEDLALQIVTGENATVDLDITFVGEGTGNQGGGEITLATLCSAPDQAAALASLGLIRGDLDGSGDVGFLDFLALANNFGNNGTYQQGDIDCNGSVGFLDFLALANNFGQSSAVEAASVPEPSSWVLLLGACLIGLSWRGRRS